MGERDRHGHEEIYDKGEMTMKTISSAAGAMSALLFTPMAVMAHGGHPGGHEGVFGLVHVLGPALLTLTVAGVVALLAVGSRRRSKTGGGAGPRRVEGG